MDSIVGGLGCDRKKALERLRLFVRQLVGWNRSVSNLISRNDETRIVTRHLRESLEPAAWLSQSGAERWVDFGSGAGFPAIPLAIVGVGQRWTLVESRRPKALFLRKAILDTEIGNVDVVHGRLETVLEEQALPTDFGGFTSRATLRLGPTLELASRVVAPGGRAFLWKGSRVREEMGQAAGWTESWAEDGDMGVGEGESMVVSFLKKL